MSGWHLGVIVPARDETRLIASCLRSIRRALDAAEILPDRAHVVVVADGCADRTGEIAARMLRGWGEVVEIDAGNVGVARRAGADRILERFAGVPPDRLWLANTDADSRVPPSWLADQLALADGGVAAVAGVIRVDSFREHGALVRRRFRLCYAGPLDAHPHVHAANLGVRADAYRAAGAWPAVPLAEDGTLWRALVAGGWATRATRAISVITSGRAVGRARGGFADLLTALGET